MAFLLLLSCEKDAGTLGLDAIGENPARAGVLSQFPVIAYSALEDSVLAVNPVSYTHLTLPTICSV